jgi:hypothetical protein
VAHMVEHLPNKRWVQTPVPPKKKGNEDSRENLTGN